VRETFGKHFDNRQLDFDLMLDREYFNTVPLAKRDNWLPAGRAW